MSESRDALSLVPQLRGSVSSESLTTVLVAFTANLLIAVAKSAAAVLTGSAALVAEAAHSWADTGNEIFLLIADRRSRRPPDLAHPSGHGREAYVWALFAALGLFIAGGAISVTHGVQELLHPEPAGHFVIGYIVLAVSFLLEGTSFLQSVRQARSEAGTFQRDLIEHVLATSDPTLRAVFAEDAAALTGLVIAAAGLGLHELTGSATPDAVASIGVGALLGVVAIALINRNLRFLVGEEADPRVRSAVIRALLAMPEVARITYLRLEIVGPRMIYVTGDVDLTGDDTESHVAVRLRALEAKFCATPAVAGAVLSLSAPDEPDLEPADDLPDRQEHAPNVPTRARRATLSARSGSPVHTLPASPYRESLTIATASASDSYGITVTTGPQISSRAMARRRRPPGPR